MIEGPEHCTIVEGWITSGGEAMVRRELSDVTACLLADGDEGMHEAVRGFQSTMRGDYVVAVARRDGSRVAVFTDSLGRLPIDSHSDGHSLVVAREPGFAAAVREGIEPDRLGIAQLVWLGYPLGQRTLLCWIQKENYLLELIRYVVLNLLCVGMVKPSEDWPWNGCYIVLRVFYRS